MFPGGMNMNSSQMRQAMKRMGVAQDELEAKSVTITLEDGTSLFFDHPNVTKVKMMGQESFQISGEYEERDAATNETTPPLEISADDVETVIAQTGAQEQAARKALEENDGDLAKAILALTSTQ